MIKFKKITLINEIEDEFNDQVDVAVEFDDGYAYVIDVTTPGCLLKEMELEKSNFVEPYVRLIVKQLSPEIITEAIETYAQKNDGYWLKFCQFGDEVDISVLNQLEVQHREEQELLELEGLDHIFYYIQKYLKILLEPIFFLILVSLTAYYLLK